MPRSRACCTGWTRPTPTWCPSGAPRSARPSPRCRSPRGSSCRSAVPTSSLGARFGMKDVPVAVRSSATSEDSPDASFAGEHDTYLWVRGAEDVIDAVRRCWASLFTDRATCYRVEMGYDHRTVEMCVVIQKMVTPKAAGVAFTLDPTNGDRSQVAIDAAWGFGEAVVAGEVTPDNYRVDKVMLDITKRIVSEKTHEYVLTDHDTVREGRDLARAGRGAVPDRHRDQGDHQARQDGRAPLRVSAGHRVGGRPRPARGRQHHPSPVPARDVLEQEGADRPSSSRAPRAATSCRASSRP